MQNKISDKTIDALAKLKQSHDNLSWFQKLFYSSALSAALIEYDTKNPNEDSVKAIYEAYNNKTWFFQRWFFPLHVPLIKKEIIPPRYPSAILVHALGEFLDPSDMAQLARTNKYYNTLFQPQLSNSELLTFVAQGKQNEAHSLLVNNPKLLLMRGCVTDLSSRSFNRVFAYQIAEWSKDTHMCRMLQSHMRTFEPTEFEEVKQQISRVTKNGLNYRQRGITKNSLHFDLTPSLEAYDSFLQAAQSNHNYFDDEVRARWIQVAEKQYDWPRHIINEFCHPQRSFHKNVEEMPQFTDLTLPRSAYVRIQKSIEVLPFESLRDNGFFGILRGQAKTVRSGIQRQSGGNRDSDSLMAAAVLFADIDMAALICLDARRTIELAELRKNLLPAEASDDARPSLGA